MRTALSIITCVILTSTTIYAQASDGEIWGCRERNFFDGKPIATKDVLTGKTVYERIGMFIDDKGSSFDLITFGKESSARISSPPLHKQDDDWMVGDDGANGFYYKGINANAGNYQITLGKRNLITYTCVKGAK